MMLRTLAIIGVCTVSHEPRELLAQHTVRGYAGRCYGSQAWVISACAVKTDEKRILIRFSIFLSNTRS